MSPAAAEPPPIHGELVIGNRAVILKDWTRGFYTYYGMGTSLTEAEFEATFPATHEGMERSFCGVTDMDGLRITFDQPIAWEWANARDALPLPGLMGLEPEEMVALMHADIGPATVGYVVFHDRSLGTGWFDYRQSHLLEKDLYRE